MLLAIPTEPIDIQIGEEVLPFQLEQQDIARCSQFLLAMDQAVMAETSQLDDLFGLEEAVLASAPLVEELLCQILLPVDGGERLSVLQA